MQRPELEALAARVVPGDGPVQVAELRAGLAHDTCRVTRDGRMFSLRVPAERDAGIEIDRRWEARVLEAAAAAGLAPLPRYVDPDRDVLVLDWVSGGTWSEDEARLPDRQARIAAMLRRLHALPIPAAAREVTPADWVWRYRGAGASAGRALDAEADERLAALDATAGAPRVLCHGDLHVLNLLDLGSSLVLLDFEYAHVSEPLWDLAGWCANNDLDGEGRRVLLGSYAAEATAALAARLEGLIWLYDYVCLLWSRLYSSGRADAGAAEEAIQARADWVARRLGRQAKW